MVQIMHIQLTLTDALGLLDWVFVDDFYPCGQPLSSDEKATVLDKHFPWWWERAIAGQKSPLGQPSKGQGQPSSGDNDGFNQNNKRTTVGFNEFALFFNHLYRDVLAVYPRIEGQGLAQGSGLAQESGRGERGGEHHPLHPTESPAISGYARETPTGTGIKGALLPPLDSTSRIASKNNQHLRYADDTDAVVSRDSDVDVAVAKKKKVARAVTSLEPKLSTRQSEAILQSVLHPRHSKNIQLFHSPLLSSNSPVNDPVIVPKQHHRPEQHHRASFEPASFEAKVNHKDKEESKDDEGFMFHNRPISAQIMIRNILQRKTTNLKLIKSNVVLAAAGEDTTSELVTRFQLSGGVLEDDFVVTSSPERNNQFVVTASPERNNQFVVTASPERNNQAILVPNRLLLSPLSPNDSIPDPYGPEEVIITQRKERLMRNLLARPTTNPSLQRLGVVSPIASIGSPGGDYDPRMERKTTTTSMRHMFYQDGIHGDDHEENYEDF